MQPAVGDDLRVVRDQDIHNRSCASQHSADVEITAANGRRWAIEAKYGAERNKWNDVHMIFGKLLRETGRSNRDECSIGLLLHHRNEDFFRQRVRRIRRDKYLAFGCLIPVAAVFVYTGDGVGYKRMTWREFYGDHD